MSFGHHLFATRATTPVTQGPHLDPPAMNTYLAEVFPEIFGDNPRYVVEMTAFRACRVRYLTTATDLRPGGTISGPTMMTLADLALYVAVLASIGKVPLAVTTNLTIDFLRKPAPKDLIAHCRLLKLGSRLAVGAVEIVSDGEDEPVAHVTGTYSIPPPDKRHI